MILGNMFNLYESATEPEAPEMPDVEIFEGDEEAVEPTSECLAEIYMESAIDIANLQASTYVADIIVMNESINNGEEAGIVMMENAVKSFFSKLIAKIKSLASKIKVWFQKLIEHVKVFFMEGSKFVAKYENALKQSVSDFEYSGKDLKDGHAKAYAKVSAFDKEYQTVMGNLQRVNDLSVTSGKVNGVGAGNSTDEKVDTIKEDIKKDFENGDFRKAAAKEYGLDSSTKYDIKDFNRGLSKDAMIKIAKDGNNAISDLQNAAKKNDSNYANLIGRLQGIEGKLKDDNVNLTAIRSQIALAQWLQKSSNSYLSAIVDCDRQLFRHSISVLKSYYRHVSKKSDTVQKNSADFGFFDTNIL